jgi:hypothetical protein
MAVDVAGNALRFDGHRWHHPVKIDGERELHSVSCPTTNFCIALDANGNALRYADGRWTRKHVFSTPAARYFSVDVSCATPHFCAAVYAEQLAVYRDGRWHQASRIVDGSDLFYAVSCASEKYCVVATDKGVIVYDGEWHHTGGKHYFGAVSCVRSLCAVDRGYPRGTWMRNDGVLGPAVDPGKSQLVGAVVCATRHFCVIGDVTDTRLGIVADGASWTDAQIPGSPDYDFLRAGDCTRHFCMLLVGTHETHAGV